MLLLGGSVFLSLLATVTAAMNHTVLAVFSLSGELADLRAELVAHPLYRSLHSLEAVRTFGKRSRRNGRGILEGAPNAVGRRAGRDSLTGAIDRARGPSVGVEKDVPGERLEARTFKELARVPASGAQDENVFHLLAAELI